MFKFFLIWLGLVSMSCFSAPQLDEKLAVFAPYLGTWQSDFEVKSGQPKVQDISKWERALNGKAIRTLHSINEGMYGGESLIFWDQSQQSLKFYYFTTAGFYTHGTLEVVSPTEFVAFEEVTNSKEGITQVKSSSHFTENAFIVSTQYLKNGQWTKPEKRHYTPSKKQVVFK
ncbi:hypothetical protein ACSLBF_17210 [Pseudoalteromonas sp. T1lg65]|uniref:hypothetical protein n=1 Tax=Pseudoalteromonas sp. T1lg65 TaxID=2077101 RepID=UPI003F7991C1